MYVPDYNRASIPLSLRENNGVKYVGHGGERAEGFCSSTHRRITDIAKLSDRTRRSMRYDERPEHFTEHS